MIGPGAPPYIIAEIGLNHNGNVDQAIAMARAAAESGARAAKFQLFRSDRFIASDASLGDEGPGSLRRFFEQFELSRDEWKRLATEVRSTGMDFFCSVFDEDSLDFYLSLNPGVVKIASSDIDNFPLLKAVSQTGLPVMLSTGAADENDIVNALGILTDAPARLLFLCVSSYPAGADDYPLGALIRWTKDYDVLTGLSDHTPDSRIALASAALGTDAWEKHFTLDRSLPGPDQSISIVPDELKKLVSDIGLIRDLVSRSEKSPSVSEINVRKYGRRALYLKSDMPAGAEINEENVIPMRPGGDGVSASLIRTVVGRRLRHSMSAGRLLREDDLE